MGASVEPEARRLLLPVLILAAEVHAQYGAFRYRGDDVRPCFTCKF